MPESETESSTINIQDQYPKMSGNNKEIISSSRRPSSSSMSKEERLSSTQNVPEKDVEKAVPPLPSGPGAFNPADFPDGGREAWLVVAGASLILFCSFGLINCAGVFVQYYANGPLKNYSTSSITWITSLQIFLQSGSNLLMGHLFDSYGTKWILPVGTVVYTLGLMLLSLSTEFYQIILTQGIICGVGAAAVFNCANNSTLTWFYKHRAAALGIVISGSSVGGVVLPILMSKLIPRIGFPWTVRILGFIALFCCSVGCFTVKSRLQPRPKTFHFVNVVKPFRELTFSLVVAAAFFTYWGIFLPYNYLNIEAQEQGISPTLVPYLLPIVNAVSILGRIIPGIIADRVGRFNVVILIASLSGIITLALWVPGKSTATTIVYGAAFGFTSGGFISLLPTIIAQISDIREIGARSGALLFVGSLGALTGSPIGGAIVTAQNGDYMGLKLWTGLTILVSALIFVVARAVQVRFRFVKI
ncbi:monocarboxylate permease-like protein [Poronia punctata]|nr:monocarboxylate permease-like protein [Poronia punctata]